MDHDASVEGSAGSTDEQARRAESRRNDPAWLTTVSLMVLAAVAVAVALWYTRPVMVPFVLAIFIAYLVSPLVDLLRVRLKLPRIPAVVITLLVVSALLGLLGVLLTTSTRGLLNNIDLYRERIVALVERAFAVFDRFGVDLGQGALIQEIRDLPLFSMVRNAAGTAFGLVTSGVLVLIFLIYLLMGRQPNRLRTGFYAEVDEKIRHFIVIKFVVSATTGLLVGIILTLFGLDLALVFGVMAFLLNFIPSVGSVFATFLPLPVALIQFDSMLAVLAVILLPGLVQVIIGNFVEPMVMGEGLDLHPVTILLALVFWGLLWGPVGMILATPITAILRIVFARVDLMRPVAELLAGRPPGMFATDEFPVPSAHS